MYLYKFSVVEHSPDAPLYISEIGYGINNQYHGMPRQGYRFHFVVKGSGIYNDKHIQEGQYFVTSPLVPDHYYPDSESPWEYFWFILDGPDAPKFLESLGIGTSSGVIWNFEKVLFFYRSFFRTDFESNAMQLYSWGCFNLMLSYIFPDTASKSKNVIEQRVQDACRYIEHFYFKNITVKDIAEARHVSDRYLYNNFQKVMGMSPKQYLSKVRFRTACFYLETSQLSVSEIASTVGFENVHHFSAFFKSMSGTSPTAYRKQHQH